MRVTANFKLQNYRQMENIKNMEAVLYLLVIYLNYIHNIIITNLILNTDMGVDKILLYKLIWSQDKNIQINKNFI